jgi:DNA-binding winged helix-turn-helix (wHTH) protein
MRLGFGDFIFDSDTRELLRDQQPLTLPPKAFQLLEILIENRPKVLSKSQLHDLLWPKTFVVEATCRISLVKSGALLTTIRGTRNSFGRFIDSGMRFGRAPGGAPI